MRQMGFFDNLKSSLTETGQDLSQKAKDTTEIFRLTNLNKTKEKEIEKVIYQIGSTYYANYRDECVEKIKKAGYEVFVEPKDIEIQSNPTFPARIAFCHGPLGEEIELFQER